jgi:hypothetical protein
VPRHWENHHTANNAVFVRHKSARSVVRGCLSLSLARQHHLDTLTLLGRYFPSRSCFQPPDRAFGVLLPPNQMI